MTNPTGAGRQQLTFNEGRTIRGNGSGGGPSTPKPDIIPKPQPAGGTLYRDGWYLMKGSDIWHPVGPEPDWAELAREKARRRGMVTADDLRTGHL